MRVIDYAIKGQTVHIHVVETEEDLLDFESFILANQSLLAHDCETTGLDWWNASAGTFRARLWQFGNARESFVVPVEKGDSFRGAVRWALRTARRLIAHNGTYDLHVAEECLGIPMEELAPKSWDTKLIAHLVDPRAVKEDGPGLKLEELTKHYICEVVAAEVKGSMTAIAKELGVKKDEVWDSIPIDHYRFLLYAGMDPILAFRLFKILIPKTPVRSRRRGLISWEHRLAHITAKIERTGYLLDTKYAQEKASELAAQQKHWEEVARHHGVDNVNSNAQIITALRERGVKLTKKTKKGNVSVDDEVLTDVGIPLTEAIVKAKKAGKWKATWFDRAIAAQDPDGRVHASVNSCQARTARMSITGAVPAQTLPAGDSYVRHCFLADPGHVTVSSDYGNMELRVLAAFSGDPTMMDAFHRGLDLHQITADAAGVNRKAGKGTNFVVCFGGGWKAIVEQYGVAEAEAKKAVKAFWETYPGVKRFADRLQREARQAGYIYTGTGRRLPVDRNRIYSALNYFIQSTSRDITARALIEIDRAGYTKYVRLPIHDELVFSFPRERVRELAEKTARIMEMTIKGLLIPVDSEIGEQPWGSVLDLEASKH
ncbi:DNA polymerase [Streptomyces eurocidicus]|uniref:DNA polymerase I n=2 Tax=Streptomyces eurocidicus TaxID=66423 RepID=A0A2N8NM01_STREU|nr:DNA polymerase [Streptomyces eurocidicus]MBF6055502.1 DNA polymerase [Streptomyces eurocidicus]PNE29799.1 DNA polymerase [Streptomyces eurocidicus]